MHTSREKLRISDDAERVQSVFILSYKINVRVIEATVVFLREGKRGTCLEPLFSTVMCKVEEMWDL